MGPPPTMRGNWSFSSRAAVESESLMPRFQWAAWYGWLQLSEGINHKKKRSEMFPHIQGGVSTTSEDCGKSPGETAVTLIRVFAPSKFISFAKLLIGLWPQESHWGEILAMWWWVEVKWQWGMHTLFNSTATYKKLFSTWCRWCSKLVL